MENTTIDNGIKNKHTNAMNTNHDRSDSIGVNRVAAFIRGIKAGIPIALGYLSVSFTFGIIAISYGFYWWQAVLISLTCLTSAGQFSGLTTMLVPGQYFDMFISQLTINIRYSFMSISLSQKVNERFRGIWRLLFGAVITDEIFAVAISEQAVSRSFLAGLALLPYIGWGGGTFLGAVMGNILPPRVMSALGLAIYGMFIAIIVPEMKRYRPVVLAVATAAILSTCFTYVPVINRLSSGLSISVCAIAAAVFSSVLHPISTEAAEEEGTDRETTDKKIKDKESIDKKATNQETYESRNL